MVKRVVLREKLNQCRISARERMVYLGGRRSKCCRDGSALDWASEAGDEGHHVGGDILLK